MSALSGSRRGLLTAAASGVLLSACGFQLRRSPELPFATVALLGFKSDSLLLQEFKRQLAQTTGTRVVDNPQQAEVQLRAYRDVREKVVAASTAAGQVREFQLRVRLEFSLSRADGRELIPRIEMLLKRDMNYQERDALGKEQEEAFLLRAMQTDIVSQVMARLAAVRLS